jgi:3-hydroxymyristoyl/3-hydroxydecanoyl-(acyl carrier protein) dehydratase
MRHEVQRSISPHHPALAGHFPGNPVVPGVVILNELVQAAEAWLHWTGHPVSVTSIKFMRLLRPNEPFTLLLEQLSESRVAFAVLREQARIAAGTLQLTYPVTDQERP